MNRRPVTVTVAALVSAALLLGVGPLPEANASGPAGCEGGLCQVKAKKKGTGGGSSTQGGGSGGGGSNAVSSGGGGKSGPSKLEIARKQQRAVDRAVAKFESSLKAYTSCVEGGGNGCKAPNAGAGGALTGVEAVLLGQPRPAGAAPAPTITPAQAGAIAVARLQLPVSAPGIGPDPDVNEWKMAAIGYPLWLWADGPTHVGPVGQNVAGLSVSLDAQLSKTVFRMGDGKSVTCAGGGKPYASWVQPGAKSPTCGYVYEKPSLPSKKYKVTATTYWDVTWTVNGVSGVIQVPRLGTVDLPVGELQAVIVR